MGTWTLAIVLRPIAALIFFAAIVIPIELLLARIWPEGRLKTVLFDRTFSKRHPLRFGAIVIALWLLMIASFGVISHLSS